MIADLGRVEELDLDAGGATLEIGTALAAELREGDSIAVDGVCLTATAVQDGRFRTQAMPETLARSSLGALEPGDAVNLELALRATDRLGGHVLQGHVDGTGVVAGTHEEGISRVLEIEADGELTRYLVEKGSVALDGVSLTVSALRGDCFAVSLIPETLERTTLGAAREGTRVNIEVDVLAKHVERLLGARA
ncbi:MAG: riboflavin synthase [Solirubrobacteraceae bacterium]